MSFEAVNLKAVSGAGQASDEGKMLAYVSNSDTLIQMLAPGYFNLLANVLDDEYFILLKGTDGQIMAKLTNTSGTVTASIINDMVAGGSAITLSSAYHGRTILYDTAAGTTITLPASSGSGVKFRTVVSVLATSNSHILQCAGSDMFQGACGIIDTDSSDATIQFAALVGDTFDTITMNRTTTGLGAPGDWVEVEDIVSGVWAVRGLIRASGTVATPFSAS